MTGSRPSIRGPGNVTEQDPVAVALRSPGAASARSWAPATREDAAPSDRSERAFNAWLSAGIPAAMVLVMTALIVVAVRSPAVRPEIDWQSALSEAEVFMAAGQIGAAAFAGQEARQRALMARQWQGLLDVGHFYRRLGRLAGSGREAHAPARQVFLAALFRARAAGSLEGVLAAGDAFGELGDHELVGAALTIAWSLAGSDANARARVLRMAARWSDASDGLPPTGAEADAAEGRPAVFR